MEDLDCIVPTYGNRPQPAEPIWGRPPPYPRAWASMLDPEAIRGLGVSAECVPCVTAYKAEHDAWNKRGVVKMLLAMAAGGGAAGAVGYLLFRSKSSPVAGALGAGVGAVLGTGAAVMATYAAMKGSEP